MKTLTATYSNPTNARAAIDDLRDAGVSSDHISLVSTHVGDELRGIGEDMPADDTLKGMLSGGAWGGALGFLAGLTALAIPGVGPIIAAGPIAAAIGGAGIGAAAGGVVGALIDLGIDEDRAEHYASRVKSGDTLVVVRVDEDMANSVQKRLNNHSPTERA